MLRVEIFRSAISSEDLVTKIRLWQDQNPLFEIKTATLTTPACLFMTILYDDGSLPKFEPIK